MQRTNHRSRKYTAFFRTLLFLGTAGSATGLLLPAQQPQLRTTTVELNFQGGRGISATLLNTNGSVASIAIVNPVLLTTCHVIPDVTGVEQCAANPGEQAEDTFRGQYDSVHQDTPNQVTATALVKIASGASFKVTDSYRVAKGRLLVFRRVRVQAEADVRLGFNSAFKAAFSQSASRIDGLHFFAPGVWYDRNAATTPSGVGKIVGYPDEASWKETRSTMPLVMMQDSAGTTFVLAHVAGDASGAPAVSSGIDEKNRNWVVDPSVQYGSFGIQIHTCESTLCALVSFRYPSEEQRSASGNQIQARRLFRSHPVRVGFEQSYTLLLDLSSKRNDGAPTGSTLYRDTWRSFFDFYHPAIAPDSTETVWKSNLTLLSEVFDRRGPEGAPGFPFKIGNLVSGEDDPYSYQMGFTGQQIPLAYELFRSGVLSKNLTLKAKGEEILNFWATEDTKAEKDGLPLTWFQPMVPPEGRWLNLSCDHPIFLRTVSDGMEGMAAAATFALQHPETARQEEIRSWVHFADGFGEWLLAHQSDDGSFRRAYNSDGSVWHAGGGCSYPGDVDGDSKFSTPFPIRFLVMMGLATGDERYKAAAYKAGEWALENVYSTGTYTGGVANRNFLDKEAGAEGLEAALALYDLSERDGRTDSKKWLTAAEAAADYLETWQYVWNFFPTDRTPQHLFRAYTFAGTRASSLIGSGESASDIFLAIDSFSFYRLHLLTGEASDGHYGRFAELLANNTSLATQLSTQPGQKFGWKYDGLTGEAVDLSALTFREDQVPIGWLAWISNVQLSPLQRLKDAFGNMSVTQLLAVERSDSVHARELKDANQHIYPRDAIAWPEDRK